MVVPKVSTSLASCQAPSNRKSQIEQSIRLHPTQPLVFFYVQSCARARLFFPYEVPFAP